MRVLIVGDKIINADTEEVIDSGYTIFREAIRYCRRQGWKWYLCLNDEIFSEKESIREFGSNLFPRLPEQYCFDQKLHKAIYTVLVKYSSGYVPRPYVTAKLVIRDLRRRGEGTFFGLWFVYDGFRVCYGTEGERVKILWAPT